MYFRGTLNTEGKLLLVELNLAVAVRPMRCCGTRLLGTYRIVIVGSFVFGMELCGKKQRTSMLFKILLLDKPYSC